MRYTWQMLRLPATVRDTDPGYFAVVMATGIISQAMRLDGAALLSAILVWVAIVAYVVLAVAYAWRLAAFRHQVHADAADPRRAFGFFTLAAGSNVLAARLAEANQTAVAGALLVIGGITWALLSYGLPLLIAGGNRSRPPLSVVNGTWFLWAVATQSIAVGLTSLPAPLPVALATLAVACWAVGVLLYLLIAAVVMAAMLANPAAPAELEPAYWVFMGAAAISVLAGAQILRLPPSSLLTAVHAVASGLSVLLWAFGTWLIPLLITLGVWRHAVHRVPLDYEPGLWSIVFPVGMYGVASHELGAALRLPWLVTLGRDEAWAALAIWAVVLAAMIAALPRRGHAVGT